MSFFEDKVIDFIMKSGSITVESFEQKFGTTELRKYISNLRKRGYKIGGIWEQRYNSAGIPTRGKRYFLESEAASE